MLYAIHALDKEGVLPTRLENNAAHREYLAKADSLGVKIVISGPLTKEDGETVIGSLFIVEADSLDAAKKFNAGDPFHQAQIWERVTITGFIKRLDNR